MAGQALAPDSDGVASHALFEATLLDTASPRRPPARDHPNLTALRDATRTRHDRLEAFVDAPATFRSQDAYREFVAALHGFHAPLEPRLRAFEPHVPALAPLPARAELLAEDLRQLGLDPATQPEATDLPALASTAEAIGALYVIEGSALGGAVLARLARRELGLTPQTGAAFFTADADLGPRWRLVALTIESAAQAPTAAAQVSTDAAQAPTDAAQAATAIDPRPDGPSATTGPSLPGIITGAQATFDALEAWLCR